MNIKTTPEQHKKLVEAMKKAAAIAQTKSTLPIMGAVLVTATPDGLTLCANNLDQAVDLRVECEVSEKGKCGLAARDLLAIASLSDSFELKLEKGRALIHGNGRFTLPTFPVEDFPQAFTMEGAKASCWTRAELLQVLRILHGVSTDASRYLLVGIAVNVAERSGAATDAKTACLSNEEIAEGFGPIIPATACSLLKTFLADSEEDLEVAFTESAASFKADDWTLYTRLIEGQFPNIAQVIPAKPNLITTVNRKALLDAVNRVRVVRNEVDKFQMVIFEDKLELSAAGQSGEATASIAAETKMHKKDFSLGLSSLYLRDCLAANDCEKLSLEFIDNLSPMVVRGDFYEIIMSMRLL